MLLTGIGGDELFWGYDWIRQHAQWCTTYLEDQAAGSDVFHARFTPRPRTLQAQVDWFAGFGGRRADGDMRTFIRRGAQDGTIPLPFYEFQPGYRAIWNGMDALFGSHPNAGRTEFRAEAVANWMAAYYTIASNETYLRVNSLVQVDRLAMQHSIESRTPLADADLVSTILSGRLSSRDHFSPPKSRMREIARAYLPDHVVNRPKRGFTPPVRDWVRAIWNENRQALSASACIDVAGLPANAARSWIRRPVMPGGRINQVALRLMTLELWLRSLT